MRRFVGEKRKHEIDGGDLWWKRVRMVDDVTWMEVDVIRIQYIKDKSASKINLSY